MLVAETGDVGEPISDLNAWGEVRLNEEGLGTIWVIALPASLRAMKLAKASASA